MNSRRGRSVICGFVSVAVVFCAGRCSRQREGAIASLVHDAKRQGRTSVELPAVLPEATEGKLLSLLQAYSLVLATPTQVTVVATTDGDNIYTWNTFRISEVLSRNGRSGFPGCRLERPGSLTLKPDEMAVPAGGGTIVIDGVTVTQSYGTWIPPKPGGAYLFFAVICSDRVAILPLYGRDVFQVNPDGKITPVTEERLTPFEYQRELESLGTIASVRRYVNSLQIER